MAIIHAIKLSPDIYNLRGLHSLLANYIETRLARAQKDHLLRFSSFPASYKCLVQRLSAFFLALELGPPDCILDRTEYGQPFFANYSTPICFSHTPDAVFFIMAENHIPSITLDCEQISNLDMGAFRKFFYKYNISFETDIDALNLWLFWEAYLKMFPSEKPIKILKKIASCNKNIFNKTYGNLCWNGLSLYWQFYQSGDFALCQLSPCHEPASSIYWHSLDLIFAKIDKSL